VPASPLARRSHYLKVRDRASFEFAVVSAAVALEMDGDRIRQARVALGGWAPSPGACLASSGAGRREPRPGNASHGRGPGRGGRKGARAQRLQDRAHAARHRARHRDGRTRA
jgi:hypothetical protein